MLFDWLVVGKVVATNPTAPVRGPRHPLKKGKTLVLAADEARDLLNAFHLRTPVGLLDRALIGPMVYTLAWVGSAITMKVEDMCTQSHRTWVRLHEKSGKEHQTPFHPRGEAIAPRWIETAALTEGTQPQSAQRARKRRARNRKRFT